MNNQYEIIDGVEKLEAAIERVKQAQQKFATYTQEQVDRIFLAAASAANKQRISLAKLAVAETGMGVVEDKVIKNHYAAEYIYNAYKDTKTCGVIEEDTAYGIKKSRTSPDGVVIICHGSYVGKLYSIVEYLRNIIKNNCGYEAFAVLFFLLFNH